MPGLDSSTYALAHLRLDGRRWNELRRVYGQISTQPSADGSSVFSLGNTAVLCTVSGPQELRRTGARDQSNEARLDVEINMAAFSQTDRKRRTRTDKCVPPTPFYSMSDSADGYKAHSGDVPHYLLSLQ